MTFRLLAAVMLFVFPLGGTAAANDDPSVTARAFFTAYMGGDVERASGYWKSGAVEKFRAAAARTAAARCFVLRDLDLRVIESTPQRARVDVDATVMTWSALPGAVPAGRSIFSVITLEPEAGQWKIVGFRDREEAVADAIAKAGAARRRELSSAAATLRTPRLASLLSRRAISAINQLQFDDAAGLLDLAERMAVETGDAVAESEVLAAKGTLLYKGTIRDFDAALELGDRSIAMAEATKDGDALTRALLRNGRVRSVVLGGPDVATFDRIVAMTDLVEDVGILVQSHSQLTIAADARGDHRETFRHAFLVDKYARASGEPGSIVTASTSLGGAFQNHGDLELAAAHYQHAADLAKRIGHKLVFGSMMRNMAMLHREAGRIDAFLKAIDAALEVGEDFISFDALLMRASHSIAAGDFAGAEADLKAAEGKNAYAQETSRDWLLEARLQLLVKQGRCEEALRVAPQPCKEPDSCAAAIELVHALSCLGRKDDAIAMALRILEDTERRRATSSADVSQRSLLQERHARVYELVVDLLVDQKRFREALTVADRSKARILADARNQSLLTSSRLTGNDRLTYDRLNERIRSLNRALLVEGTGENAERLRDDLQKARTEMRELFTRADAALAAATSRPKGSVLDDTVPAPPAGVAVIEYLCTKDRLLAFAVTRSADGTATVTGRVIPIARADLKRLVDDHFSAIEHRDLRHGERSRELFDLLLAPFDSLIRKHRALCVVPEGELWRVPFHALKTGSGRYLLETTSVFYAPSIAALELVPAPRTDDAPPTILALANPNIRARTRSTVRALYRGEPLAAIPETEREVRSLEKIYGRQHSRILVGDEAHEGVLKRESPNYSVLHIAAHGILDEKAPWYSALALSAVDDREDGLLEAREIAELPLRADLAVLSACDTGRGRASAGEGVIGFSWALLAAGCPNAVVSQWRAESTATMELMIEFHRDFVQSGRRSPSDSLRRAALSMMQRYPHPYYWAPFIVVGRDR